MSKDKGGTVYPPAEAARLLEISVSGLRRYGLLYEEIFYPVTPRPPGAAAVDAGGRDPFKAREGAYGRRSRRKYPGGP